MTIFTIQFSDKSTKQFNHKPTVIEAIKEHLGEKYIFQTVGGTVSTTNANTSISTNANTNANNNSNHDVILDLRDTLEDQSLLKIIDFKDELANEVVRHTCAHVMAQAVQELWPEVKVAIGPTIEKGFYYDFYAPFNFVEEDLKKIENKMKEIIKKGYEIKKELWSKEQALDFFNKKGETFKIEIINDLDENQVSVYKQGEWVDLCRGPHLLNTKQIKAFKLLSLAGSYWRGDENKERLQRIYGTAFCSKEDLKNYLNFLEEAKKRDHRKLGKELEIFYFHEYSPGSPFFLPNGVIIYQELVNFLQQLYRKYNYQEIITPQLYDLEIYKKSGHYDNYRENMFFTEVDQRSFSLKPMNCPGHCLVYLLGKKSYKNLPLRLADFGRLHRNELSGVMHGLSRVRSFSQDDAHIFCTYEQLQGEIENFINFLQEVYKTLGMLEYKVFLSTRPEKRMGNDEIWDKSEDALRFSLEKLNICYTVNPGDGAFYGPKLDIMFVDAIKRSWQLATLQCDFNMPEAFDLKYTGEDNKPHRPVILHRAVLGSLERFLGVYLEHIAGHFPLWLAPIQVRILNVTDRVNHYCENLYNQLKEQNIRCDFDRRNEKLNYKIREAQIKKIPYMIIIGDKEKEKNIISIRKKDGKTINDLFFDNFLLDLKKEIANKTL